MPNKNVREEFMEDVASHRMTALLDQGVYRHLDFRQADGSWNHGFHIITTPWRLIVTGDMGTWVFSRLEDMFCFFRTDGGRVNPSYWSEKVVNGVHGGSDGCKDYDGDAYRQRLIDSLDDYGITKKKKAEVIRELKSLDFDDEHWIIGQIRDFECDDFTFQDVWEIDMKVYSYHFLWCLEAIVHGIAQYDAMKAQVAA